MQRRLHKTIRIRMGSIKYDDQASAIDDAISLALAEIESAEARKASHSLKYYSKQQYMEQWLFLTVIAEYEMT